MSRRIAVLAVAPNARWRGPLRAFLDSRARELRDESAVWRARVCQHEVEGQDAWAIIIDFAHEYGARELVRDLVAELEALNASPAALDWTSCSALRHDPRHDETG